MKRIFVLLMLFSFFKINAQDFKVGFGAGLNLSKVYGKSTNVNPAIGDYHSDFKIGPNLGVEIECLFNDFIGIGTGIKYYNKNSDNVKLHYLSIPLTVLIIPVKKLSFDFGGDIEQLIYASIEKENASNGYFNKLDFNIIMGLNYQLSNKLKLSVKYMYGLKSIDINNANRDYYNRSIGLMIYYRIK